MSELRNIRIEISVVWQKEAIKRLRLDLRKHDRWARRLGRRLRAEDRRMHQDYRRRQLARRRRGRRA